MTRLTGLTLADDVTARWVESRAAAIGCVEIVADGFFSRPSPYLAWLGAEFPLVVRATALPDEGSTLAVSALARVCSSAQARFVSIPLAVQSADGIRLTRLLPPLLTAGSIACLATRLVRTQEAVRAVVLAEPIAAPLRLTSATDEPSFLAQLCQISGCRLLVDVTTLAVDGENHGFDPVEWLGALPRGLIAAARIGGSQRVGSSWVRDPAAPIQPETWGLLEQLCDMTTLEVMVLDERVPASPEVLVPEFGRLCSLPGNSRARLPVSTDAAGPAPTPYRRPADANPRFERPSGDLDRVPTVTDDVALFVLDSEGVCFLSTRRELTLFNTAATLVWCLLEDGDNPSAIARTYSETFSVTVPDAERQVGTVLRDWFGRGLVSSPGELPATPVSLLTAISMVLTNTGLRASFRNDPHAVADRLVIEPADRAAFIGVNPDELDAQALEESLPPVAPRMQPWGCPTVVSDHRRRELVGCYRLLDTTFAVRADALESHAALHHPLAHLSVATREADVVLEVRDGSRLFEDGEFLFEARSPAAIVPAVKQRLRAVAVARRPFLLSVHAAVLAFGDACVLLPAAAGSGKTTLTAGLIRSGATYFSDEIALLDPDTLFVTPVPLALTIKDGSVEPLRSLYPELDRLATHVREDYVRVRYLPPPEGSLPCPSVKQRIRFIVFPSYAVNAGTALLPVSRPSALRRLLDESSLRPHTLDRDAVEALIQWMRGVDCYELPFSSLSHAVDLVRGLFE